MLHLCSDGPIIFSKLNTVVDFLFDKIIPGLREHLNEIVRNGPRNPPHFSYINTPRASLTEPQYCISFQGWTVFNIHTAGLIQNLQMGFEPGTTRFFVDDNAPYGRECLPILSEITIRVLQPEWLIILIPGLTYLIPVWTVISILYHECVM